MPSKIRKTKKQTRCINNTENINMPESYQYSVDIRNEQSCLYSFKKHCWYVRSRKKITYIIIYFSFAFIRASLYEQTETVEINKHDQKIKGVLKPLFFWRLTNIYDETTPVWHIMVQLWVSIEIPTIWVEKECLVRR